MNILRTSLSGCFILVALFGTACAQFPAATSTRPAAIAPTSLPLVTLTPSPVPATSAPTTAPVTQVAVTTEPRKRISFKPGGTSALTQGSIAPNGVERYVLRAQGGQTLTVELAASQEKMILLISGADRNVLLSQGQGAMSWSGKLPATQDYNIDVIYSGNAPANFLLLTVIPPPPGSGPEPTRISFQPGGTAASVQDTLPAFGLKRYVLRAQVGQIMSVNVNATQGEAILVIFSADGDVLISDHAEAKSWTGPLPSTQDYIIDIKAGPDSSANYSLQVVIPPLTTVTSQPTPSRVSFPRGGTSAVLQGSLVPGGNARYVFRALAGQTVSLQVSSAQGRIILSVSSADGNVLLADNLGSNGIAFKLPTTQDYVVGIRSDGVAVESYTLLIAIPPPY